MGEATHSPLPWKSKRRDRGYSYDLRGADGRLVASASWHHCSPDYPTEEVTAANFAVIAESVNSNAALRKRIADMETALRLAEGRLLLLLRAYPDQHPKFDHPTATSYVLDRVTAALGKEG